MLNKYLLLEWIASGTFLPLNLLPDAPSVKKANFWDGLIWGMAVQSRHKECQEIWWQLSPDVVSVFNVHQHYTQLRTSLHSPRKDSFTSKALVSDIDFTKDFVGLLGKGGLLNNPDQAYVFPEVFSIVLQPHKLPLSVMQSNSALLSFFFQTCMTIPLKIHSRHMPFKHG